MKVLITLQDVEPAVRINARLEQDGIETDVVSPLDDIRAAHQAREARHHRVHRRADRSVDRRHRQRAAVGRRRGRSVSRTTWTPHHSNGFAPSASSTFFRSRSTSTRSSATFVDILERRRLQKQTGLIGESRGDARNDGAGRADGAGVEHRA